MKSLNLLLALLLGSIVILSGQTARLQSPMIAESDVSLQYWKAKDDQLIQCAVPVSFVYPYNDKIRLYAVTSPAVTSLTAGSDYSLAGLSDIKLGGHWLMLNDEMLLTFGLNVPVGKSVLESDEIPVAGAMTLPAFELRVPGLGQGFDVQLGFNTAWEWGDYVVGHGISYIYKGPFQVFEDADMKYDPGNEVTVTWGVQREVNWFQREMRMTADILYTGYSRDRFGDQEGLSSGDRVIVQASSQFKEKAWDVTVFVRERIKAPNSYGTEILLKGDRMNANGNQLQVLALGTTPWKRDMLLKAAVDLKVFANNDYDVGGALLLGAGGGLEKNLSKAMTAGGECRLYIGSLKQSADAAFVFGVKVLGGIRYKF